MRRILIVAAAFILTACGGENSGESKESSPKPDADAGHTQLGPVFDSSQYDALNSLVRITSLGPDEKRSLEKRVGNMNRILEILQENEPPSSVDLTSPSISKDEVDKYSYQEYGNFDKWDDPAPSSVDCKSDFGKNDLSGCRNSSTDSADYYISSNCSLSDSDDENNNTGAGRITPLMGNRSTSSEYDPSGSRHRPVGSMRYSRLFNSLPQILCNSNDENKYTRMNLTSFPIGNRSTSAEDNLSFPSHQNTTLIRSTGKIMQCVLTSKKNRSQSFTNNEKLAGIVLEDGRFYFLWSKSDGKPINIIYGEGQSKLPIGKYANRTNDELNNYLCQVFSKNVIIYYSPEMGNFSKNNVLSIFYNNYGGSYLDDANICLHDSHLNMDYTFEMYFYEKNINSTNLNNIYAIYIDEKVGEMLIEGKNLEILGYGDEYLAQGTLCERESMNVYDIEMKFFYPDNQSHLMKGVAAIRDDNFFALLIDHEEGKIFTFGGSQFRK